MQPINDRLDFAPPTEPAGIRAFGLAVFVHLLLGAALTWGVNWNHSTPDVTFDAELWASVPQEAAPAPAAPAPPPPAPPTPPAPPPPAPPPPPPPPPAPAPPPPAPAPPKVDIALEQEKQRKLKEAEQAKKAAEAARLKAQAAAEKKREEEKREEALAAAKKAEAQKLEAQKQAAQKLAAQKEAAQKAEDAERRAEARIAEERKRQLDRMMGLAGATGSESARGSAQVASGPSPSYGGRVRAKVRPNIVFTEVVSGNPTAEVEVRTTPDGTILSQRLVKSSGNKAWDAAVVKAIIRTESLPRDVDGRVPTPIILSFKPND